MSNIILQVISPPEESIYTTLTLYRSDQDMLIEDTIKGNIVGMLVNQSGISKGAINLASGPTTFTFKPKSLYPNEAAKLLYFLLNYTGMEIKLTNNYLNQTYYGVISDWDYIISRGGKKGFVKDLVDIITYSGDPYINIDGTAQYFIKPEFNLGSDFLKKTIYDFTIIFIASMVI